LRDIWDESVTEAEGFDVNTDKFNLLYTSYVKSYRSSKDIKYFLNALDLCRAAIAIYARRKETALINKVISDFCSDFSPYEYFETFSDSMLYCVKDNEIQYILSYIDKIKEKEKDRKKAKRTVYNIWGNLSGDFLYNHNVEELKKKYNK
jgi:hypothetical protein